MTPMRWLHLIVVATLVSAAVDVYKIKFESTVQAERVAKLHTEIRRERDAIAALRAQWAQLDNPARIQALAQRHLALRPTDPTQIDSLDHLPERPPPPPVPPAVSSDEAVADVLDDPPLDDSTGSTSAIGIEPLQAAPAAPDDTR
jgi:hypothetical protein